MSNPQKMEMSDWAALLVLSVLWGGSFFFSKIALEALPPFALVLIRVGIAALTLGLYLWMSRVRLPWSRPAWTAFAVMGLFNNLIPFSLLFWGQTAIASGLASILNATTPIFSLLVGHAFTTDERLSVNKVLGIGLGLAGVATLVGPDALLGSHRSVFGMLACLGAALSYGIASIFGKRFRRMGIPPAVGAFGQVTTTTIMMIPIVLIFDPPWQIATLHARIWIVVVALGTLSTALAYILYFRLIGRSGAVNASLVTLLIPVSAVSLGGIFLREHLTPGQFLGMAMIGCGLLAMDGRILRSRQRHLS